MSPLIQFFAASNSHAVRELQVPPETPLAEAASDVGWALRSDCGGRGVCGKCRIQVNGKERLGCQVIVRENMTVEIPRASLKTESTDIVVQQRDFLDQTVQARNPEGGHGYGIALDLGTTTLAAELLEAAPSDSAEPIRFLGVTSRANPQREFGDDLISRIQKTIEEPISLISMQEQTLETVTEMIAELSTAAGLRLSDISRISIAGNTVMENLFHGIDPSPLGRTPFEPPIFEFPARDAANLGLPIAATGIVETLPILGGFVGGDLTAGILATRLHETEGPAFLIDIGTNGELVLQYEGEIDVAATAAGPALEGGRIEFGCQAVPGAINHIELYPDGGVEFSTIAGKPARGLCGSGLIDAVSELLRHGLIDRTGRFALKPDSPFLARWKIVDGKPNFILAEESQSSLCESILLTQRDVRQFQLAVGAIRAGIQILLRNRNLTPERIKRFDVAGGFGSFIRPKAARRVGLLPKEIPLDYVRFCGNTSLAGARLTLFDADARAEALTLARRVRHHDLAVQPDFAALFAENMLFAD